MLFPLLCWRIPSEKPQTVELSHLPCAPIAKNNFHFFEKYRDELVLQRSLLAARVVTEAKSSSRPMPFVQAAEVETFFPFNGGRH